MTGSSVYFHINWRVWQLLGGVELNEWNIHSLKYWIAVALNVPVTGAFPIMLCLAMFSFDHPLDNLLNFNISITSVATVVKFLMYVKQLKKILEIEELLEELDNRMNTEEQRETHNLMSKQLNRMSKMFIWAYAIAGVNSNTSFIFREERSLPFPATFPLDWKNSMSNYVLALILQIIAITVQILQNFVDDLFPPLVLCIIAGNCELLIQRISIIGYDDKNDQKENELELIYCIQDQEKLYRLLRLTMDIISWPMLVQFIVIAIDLGAAVCGLAFFVETTQEKLYYISFTFALGLQIFPVCYYGTLVEYLFGYLHWAVYSSNWVDQSILYRQNAIIFQERTKRLPKLLAGNFIPIALTTFLANTKAAYSFFTLIADSQED